jgi:oligoendopeptidase F
MSKHIYYKKKQSNIFRYIVITFTIIILLFFLSGRESLIKKTTSIKETMKAMTEKNKLKNLPVWDLTTLYSSIKAPEIQTDLEILNRLAKNFEREYKINEKLYKINGTNLFRAIKTYETINEGMTKLEAFAYLNYAQDLSNEENSIFYQKISEELTKISNHLVFFSLDLNKLSKTSLDIKYAESPALNKYRQFIEDIRTTKKYQLDEKTERLFLDKSITSKDALRKLFDQTTNTMVFVYNGQNKNVSEMLKLLSDKNPEVRKKAGKVFGEKLGENIKLFAFITNTLAKDKAISDEWRGFKEPISSRNLSNLIDDDVVEALIKTVEANYPNLSHRYYRLKAKMMRKDKLNYTDRNAPLPFDDNKIYSWNETKQIVLNAYRNFSPTMAEIGQKFFDNSWIDVPTRPGKRSGAFAAPTVSSAHPFILLNYQGEFRDIMTLAHELGHGIHQYLSSKEQPFLMSFSPLTLAETASVFGEQLTFQQLLNSETDLEKRKVILANKIEDMLNTVVRQIAFLNFEKRIHNERKYGEIPVERINEIWLETQKASLGDIFNYEDEYKYYWAYIPHFIHSPFYVYAYAFGDCLVNSLYAEYQKHPKGFEEKYIKLLKAGSSKRYDELLKPFGLNPKDASFWQNGLDMIIQLIDELEKMVNK